MSVGDLVALPGHLQFGELLLGHGTAVRWQKLTGWEDSPGVDSGTVPRAGAHGAIPGRLLAQPRTITVDGVVLRTPPGAMTATVRQLGAHLALRDDELPLVVRLDDAPPLLTYARCLRHSIPVDTGYRIGTVTGGAIQFEASDPRRYSLIEQRAEIRLPAAEPGLDWHLDPSPERLGWPLDFGAPGSTGTTTATNEGTTDTHPIITFRGPVDRPSLTNLATGDVIEYDIKLADSDELTVDTAAGTVTLNGTASRLSDATARSVPEETLMLRPGVTSWAFRAAPGFTDPRAACIVQWRSAYW